jgi:hypothetical protein
MNHIALTQANPFAITKAVDLNDEQILRLWVSVSDDADDFAEYARPGSPMPTFIMGAKGSGKTHLMRYHSFELQALRHRQNDLDLRSGIKKDGYVGIYMRCSGLNSGRFANKRQLPEVWRELFAYYIELWLAQHLLHIARDLELGTRDGDEADLCAAVLQLFDKAPLKSPTTVEGLSQFITNLQRHLDFEVNNCVLTGTLNVEVLATRGRLIFGIPKIFAQRYSFLKDVLFVYSVDEFENLTFEQQKLVNTLVREKELPSTLRIGSRLYGVKTHATDSADEENLRNSEYEEVYLDQLFRKHKKRYSTFAKQLIEKRLAAAYGVRNDKTGENAVDVNWNEFFENWDDSWKGTGILNIFKGIPSDQRQHLLNLGEKLAAAALDQDVISKIVTNLRAEKYPLLEKLNILLLFQEFAKGAAPLKTSIEIRSACKNFLNAPTHPSPYATALDHYKSDLVAQLRRESGQKQLYLGLDDFIIMSAGLPRAVLTILRSVFEWSLFNGEDPLRKYHVSLAAQQRGVRDAADWFYENMRKAGEDGLAIQTAVDRLAQLFRVNRFADKPVESSLIAFSVAEEDADAEARRILRLAEDRSFLIRVSGGQRDKNSKRVTTKYQLNNMLCARWDLPLGRRGTIPLDAVQFNAVFDATKGATFKGVLQDWEDRMAAPHFGKAKGRGSSTGRQHSLF